MRLSHLLLRRSLALSLVVLLLGFAPPAPTPAASFDEALFEFPVYLPGTNPYISDIVAGDLNNDGSLDLVVGTSDDFPIQVFMNGGDGTFKLLAVDTPELFPTSSLALGDVNGDGVLDLFTGSSIAATGAIFLRASRIMLGNGDGTFGTVIELPDSPGTTNDGAFGDLNGDGTLDLVMVGGYYLGPQTSSRVYLTNRDGSITEMPPLPGDPSFGTPIVLSDVTGDGALDVLSGNTLYTGHGDGTFAQPVPLPLSTVREAGAPGIATTPTAMPPLDPARDTAALGDFNGDGRPDLIAGGKVYLATRAGTFTLTSTLPGSNNIPDALGDIDGDGTLDLVTPNGVYLGRGDGTFGASVPYPDSGAALGPKALGDLNGDGVLDVAIGDASGTLRIFFGTPRIDFQTPIELPISATWLVGDIDDDGKLDLFGNGVYRGAGDGTFRQIADSTTNKAAIGDINGDGKLDYVDPFHGVSLGNGDGTFTFISTLPPSPTPPTPPQPTPENTMPSSAALGDLNGDGKLDIVLGYKLASPFSNNVSRAARVLLGHGDGTFAQPTDIAGSEGNAVAVAIGDLNGDGVLDLVDANAPFLTQLGSRIVLPSRVYLGKGDGTFGPPNVLADSSRDASSVALGDFDGNDSLDIVLGNNAQPSQVFLGRGDGTFEPPTDLTGSGHGTSSVAVGDLSGDGTLDIVLGNLGSPSRVYLGRGNGSFSTPVDLKGSGRSTLDVSLGDLNRDGLPDIVLANMEHGASQIYLSSRAGHGLLNNPPSLSVRRPGPAPDANFYSTPAILAQRIIPVRYTLTDPESDPVGSVRAFYSLDGGGSWQPAVEATVMNPYNLPTSSTGTEHVFNWDTFASGVFGQSDNVVFRIEAYGTGARYIVPPGTPPATPAPSGAFQILLPKVSNGKISPGRLPDLNQRPFASATTFPFRVRGTQARVLRDGQPQAGAIVYRLHGQQGLGNPLGPASAPFTTDPLGYLRGRGDVRPGDQLLALAPISSTATYTLYATNGAPTETGVDAFTVTSSGVQTLTVSLDHPLILFNLNVSLEWDASQSPGYLDQLQFNLERTSRYLYDFTNGQVALGRINVHQNADDWAFSDVVIHATNRLRPFAAEGGSVITPTVDPQRPDIIYDTGQVHIGATWNRYGTPGQNLGEDWPIILAHELSHYLLFQDDAYLGLNKDGLLVSVRTCSGSAMGDVYTSPDATEFIADRAHWEGDCANTLANQTLGRTEWQTLDTWYPALHPPTQINPGPGAMPFDFTRISIAPPITPTAALADPTFYLDYAGGQTSSNEARAYLERGDAYVIDLGTPFGGQNRVLAYGAKPGDRLCVFDRPRAQFGCETIVSGDDRLALRQDTRWTPVIQLTPVTSRTFDLAVDGLPAGLPLKARLFPEYGPGAPAIALPGSGGVYRGRLTSSDPALAGTVQLWVDEAATETQPRREAIVSFAIGGNPGFSRGGGGFSRGGGGFSRGGGGFSRGGGGFSRGGGAPLISPDGQMIFFTPNPVIFQPGQFYTLQNTAGLPPLPAGKIVIGQGYSLVATAGTPVITGSISVQYLENDVLTAGANENTLTIHHWDGTTWRAMPTLRDTYVNLASAQSQGPGIYALMAGTTTPQIASVSPASATNNVATTLMIRGSGFVPPAQVTLIGATATYTLPVTRVLSTTMSAQVPTGLPADAYSLVVTNGDGGRSAAAAFAVYAPSPARFYDFFESGSGRWQLNGEWGIVALPDGNHAITDSPAGNYNSAIPPAATRTTSITSQPFNLDGLAKPMLTFRHDYVLAKIGASQDVARVQITTDNGATWTTLASYSGGGIYGARLQPAPGEEWNIVNWKRAAIDLSGYSGTVQVRFSLQVDQTAADKGWIIDDVTVQ